MSCQNGGKPIELLIVKNKIVKYISWFFFHGPSSCRRADCISTALTNSILFSPVQGWNLQNKSYKARTALPGSIPLPSFSLEGVGGGGRGERKNNRETLKRGIFLFFLFMYVIPYFYEYICRASDFTVTEGAGIGATHTALLPHKHHHPCFHTWRLHAALLPHRQHSWCPTPLMLLYMTPLILHSCCCYVRRTPLMLLLMALFIIILHCCHPNTTQASTHGATHAVIHDGTHTLTRSNLYWHRTVL